MTGQTDPLLDVIDRLTIEPGLVHLTCGACDPDTALCGRDVSGREETDEDGDCVVCIDLADAQYPFCAKCGWDWRVAPRGKENAK